MATYNPGPKFTLTSGWSEARVHPITGTVKRHAGEDWAPEKTENGEEAEGTEIPAAFDGTVFYAGAMRGYGNTIVLEHTVRCEKVYTLYAHLYKPSTLKVGQKVLKGQIVGGAGKTGDSTGVHLHFEVIKDQSSPLKPGHETYNPREFDFSASDHCCPINSQ